MEGYRLEGMRRDEEATQENVAEQCDEAEQEEDEAVPQAKRQRKTRN